MVRRQLHADLCSIFDLTLQERNLLEDTRLTIDNLPVGNFSGSALPNVTWEELVRQADCIAGEDGDPEIDDTPEGHPSTLQLVDKQRINE